MRLRLLPADQRRGLHDVEAKRWSNCNDCEGLDCRERQYSAEKYSQAMLDNIQ
jgi:hypothetical protein